MLKVLLVGIYDTNTVSLAPHILKAYVEQFDILSKYEIVTREFSIFSDTVEYMIKGIKEEKADVVGFSVYIWNCNEIKKIIKRIDAVIILGGPHVNGIEEELMCENPDIDIIVTGEGELRFKELLEFLTKGKQIDKINGITTQKQKAKHHGPIELKLDSIPSIYNHVFRENPNISWISFETSRGCPMSCKYCTWSSTKKMRYFSLKRVKKDLDIILGQNNIDHIYLCDSSLLLKKKRAKHILQHIIDSGTRKQIRFEFTAEQLNDEIIDLLKKLPNNEYNFAIQSTNERALSDAGRKFNRKNFEEGFHKIVNTFKTSNITIDLIYGLPGDDIEGYKESMNYAISLSKVHRILTNPLIVLPGSEFYEGMDKYGIKLRDKKSYIIKENYTFSQEEMEMARRYSFLYIIHLSKLSFERMYQIVCRIAKEEIYRYNNSIYGIITVRNYEGRISRHDTISQRWFRETKQSISKCYKSIWGCCNFF